jgi:hypothetical protein
MVCKNISWKNTKNKSLTGNDDEEEKSCSRLDNYTYASLYLCEIIKSYPISCQIAVWPARQRP